MSKTKFVGSCAPSARLGTRYGSGESVHRRFGVQSPENRNRKHAKSRSYLVGNLSSLKIAASSCITSRASKGERSSLCAG